tara:strand:+ start:283 stop:708 length:426 start_codon:yes stop_codon:yes gene_type:complete
MNIFNYIFSWIKPIIITNSNVPKILNFGDVEMYGLCLFPFIFIVDMEKINESVYFQKEVINHEKIHFYQIIETGVIGFYLLFLLELLGKSIYYRSIKRGYLNISFEIEAYKNMKNLDYLKHRKKYNWIKYLTKKDKKKKFV